MKKLKVQFWRLENVLIMKVLEQDESLRDQGYICGDDDYVIESRACPSLNDHTLYLRGDAPSKDNSVAAWSYTTIAHAKDALTNFSTLIKAFNDTKETLLSTHVDSIIVE